MFSIYIFEMGKSYCKQCKYQTVLRPGIVPSKQSIGNIEVGVLLALRQLRRPIIVLYIQNISSGVQI